MAIKKYPKIIQNEDGFSDWIKPLMKGYRMACCDCCLVHKTEFRVIKKKKIIKSIVGILESGLLQRCEVKEREKKDGVLHEREKTNCHGKLYILFLLFYL